MSIASQDCQSNVSPIILKIVCSSAHKSFEDLKLFQLKYCNVSHYWLHKKPYQSRSNLNVYNKNFVFVINAHIERYVVVKCQEGFNRSQIGACFLLNSSHLNSSLFLRSVSL